MTDQIQQARRAAFEAWARNHNSSLQEDDADGPEDIRLDRQAGVYIWANAESAWLAFNAALDSICIELPLVDCIVDEDGFMHDVMRAEDVRAAIEQNNMGIKTR